jgi:hypothetical protein
MRESAVERRLTREVQRLGGVSVKIMPVVAGTPDRLILLPGGQMYLVETKAPTGSLRPAQVVWHARAAAIGTVVTVLSSVQEVAAWVEAHGETST